MEVRKVFGTQTPKLVETYSHAFPEIPKKEIRPLLEWKFFREGHHGSYWVTNQENTQEILGGYGVIDMPLSSELKIGVVCDVFTNPKFQKQGIFSKTSSMVYSEISNEGFDLTIGFPVRKAVMPGHLKNGWEIRFEMPIFITSPFFLIRCNRKNKTDMEIVFKSGCDLEVEDLKFLTEVQQSHDLLGKMGTRYSNKFLSWRLSRPSTSYYQLTIKSKGKVIGWAVLRRVKLKHIPTLAILDFQVAEKNPNLTKEFFNFLARLAFKKKCFAVSGCWNPSFADHLGVTGIKRFIKVGRQTVITRNHSDRNIQVLEEKTNLSWINSDTL